MSAGAMEQFDECGGLVHGGEMVRLGAEGTKVAALEGQLTSPGDVTQAKSFFGQLEPPPPPVDNLPGLTFANQSADLQTTTMTTPDVVGTNGSALSSGIDVLNGGAAGPGGLLSGMFEILTEVISTTPPVDPLQVLSNTQPG